jgi:hypothetical protein
VDDPELDELELEPDKPEDELLAPHPRSAARGRRRRRETLDRGPIPVY